MMPGKRYDRQFKLAAARLVLEGNHPVKDIADELELKDCTLRRWAQEYEENGEAAFPGSGSFCMNKDYEILKLKKENEELKAENDLLKNSGLNSIGQRNTSSSLAVGVMNPSVFLGRAFRRSAISSSSSCE